MDADETGPVPRQDLTFWQRNALAIITATLGVLFALVIIVQIIT